MKKLITILCLALLPFCVMAKSQAKIEFAEKSFNFGNIQEKGGKVTHTFTFTNTGNANLMILDATAECGCTEPQYPKNPIPPGKTGTIKVTYNPLYRPGPFTKNINIRTNGNPKKTTIKITGVVK